MSEQSERIHEAETLFGLFKAGNFPEAIEFAKKMIAILPSDHLAQRILAASYCSIGQPSLAQPLLVDLYERFPKDRFVRIWMARCESALGHYLLAADILMSILEGNPNDLGAVSLLGRCYAKAGQAKAAAIAFIKAVQLDPNSSELHLRLGTEFAKFQEYKNAIQALTVAHQLEPKSEEIGINLADVFRLTEQLELAEAVARTCLASNPHSTQTATLLARILAEREKNEEAAWLFERTISSDPNVLFSYSEWLQELGRFELATECMIKSLKIQPDQGSAYYQLSRMRRFSLDRGPWIGLAIDLYNQHVLEPEQQMFLAFALGAAHETAGDFKSAMDCFNQANRGAFDLYNGGRLYDRALDSMRFDQLYDLIHPWLGKPKDCETSELSPIFVVGMIRSGTTLLAQILSGTSVACSVGEPSYWLHETAKLLGGPDKLLQSELDSLAGGYFAFGRKRIDPQLRIVDKMPMNYRCLGLIKSAIPTCKIIHLKRHPVDTCLSIYSNHFGPGLNWMYDQFRITENYLEYRSEMSGWRGLTNELDIFEIDYEELVEHPEQCLPALFKYCELPWDPVCMRVEGATNLVQSPSRWEARQPINSGSVGRWKNFEPYLNEFGRLLT